MIYFTADQHFGHSNIIKLCGRPYSNAEEMDEDLIAKWNTTVAPEDTIYVLGDFMYKSKHPLAWYTDTLNGKKHLVRGNHDHAVDEIYLKHFEEVRDLIYLDVDKTSLVLLHYPMLSWRRRARGAIHLYGHVHGAILPPLANQRAYNVGVDTNDFRPISLPDIITKMLAKEIKVQE